MSDSGLRRARFAICALIACASPAAAQTITGTLLDSRTHLPIDLGYVALLTETGDSVTAMVTDENGLFVLGASEPGGFKLLASALGYREATAGIFDLGEDGLMDVQFRLDPQAISLDGLIVQAERVAQEPGLMKHGFYDRVERGFGKFITPEGIAGSVAFSAADLFRGIPGVTLTGGGTGDRVLMQTLARWCSPTLYVDGARISTAVSGGAPLEVIAPLVTIAAVEVYRRPAEIPVQFSVGQLAGVSPADRPFSQAGGCGVILIWTKG